MKYLWMSTSKNISTGYGILANNVVERLIKKGVDLRLLGMQNVGYQKEDWNLSLLNDIYGSDSLDFYTKIYGIDYVITVIDNFVPVYHYIPSLLKKLKVGHICHCTINSAPLSPLLADRIKDADFWICPSKFAEKVLLDGGFDKKRIFYIPHGVNTKIFKPLPEDEIIKFKEMINYKDKFVFLAVATNTGLEKNWQGVFYAYKIFLAHNPDAKEKTVLHCHTSPYYPGGYDMELLAKMYGIAENIRFVAGIGLNAGSPPEEMAKLYNISDCYISSTMGESFSLPALEAMSCGTPCIIPNHTTGPELVGEPEAGLLIDLLKMKNGQEYSWTGPTISDKWIIDPVDMAEKMTEIYKNKELREKFSKNALKFAKGYDWKKVRKKWLDFFQHVENFVEPVDYKEKKLGI